MTDTLREIAAQMRKLPLELLKAKKLTMANELREIAEQLITVEFEDCAPLLERAMRLRD